MSNRRFTSHNHPNASLVKRLLAMMYDSLLVIAVWMTISYVFLFFNNGEAVTVQSMRALCFLLLSCFLLYFGPNLGRRSV